MKTATRCGYTEFGRFTRQGPLVPFTLSIHSDLIITILKHSPVFSVLVLCDENGSLTAKAPPMIIVFTIHHCLSVTNIQIHLIRYRLTGPWQLVQAILRHAICL